MKKLYFLDEVEKNRILNLHKSATKNQYLINEVGYGSGNWLDVNYKYQTLTLNNYLEMENKQGGDELKLNKGVVFTVKNANTLIAKNTPFQIVGDYTGSVSENGKGDVEYYCGSKEFKVIGRNLTYWGEDFQSNLQKAFDDLCGEITTGSELGKAVATGAAKSTTGNVTSFRHSELGKAVATGAAKSTASSELGKAVATGASKATAGQSDLEKNAISCGWKKQDGTADVDGYKNANWACPKPGAKTK